MRSLPPHAQDAHTKTPPRRGDLLHRFVKPFRGNRITDEGTRAPILNIGLVTIFSSDGPPPDACMPQQRLVWMTPEEGMAVPIQAGMDFTVGGEAATAHRLAPSENGDKTGLKKP